MPIIIKHNEVAMPVMDISTPERMRQHLRRSPNELYKGEELEAIHRAIRYTQQFKKEESQRRMDEESPLTRPVPLLSNQEIKQLIQKS